MNGGIDFRNQEAMQALERRYFDIVNQNNLRGWTSYVMCMKNSDAFRILPGMNQYETIFADSPRYHPKWKEQGVSPETFPSGTAEPIHMSQYVDYTLKYELHHRRIERVAMVLHSL